MKYKFEDGNSYAVEDVGSTELGAMPFLQSDTVQEDMLRLLRIRYGDRIKLEFGPGRSGPAPFVKRPWATIGLNQSADPKSDIYWDLDFGIPLPGDCIDECYANQFLEHLDGFRRIYFMNECYRVMKSGAVATFDVPHWQSPYAAGDPTHKWPPFTEASFQYFCLDKDGKPFVEKFSDYGITCRFVLAEPLRVIPGVQIIARLMKP